MSLIIPVFIPHQGCPRQCLFCNQISISGQQRQTVEDGKYVSQTIVKWLDRSRTHDTVQVAFYGGSFTCLATARQEQLLAAVQPFLQSGQVNSVRLSTRPDCVSEAVCDFLLTKGVQTVELGVQSLDDRVLTASKRGHSAQQSLEAAVMLKEKGLHLGIQLMPGLPGETTRSFAATVRQVVDLQPEFVRLYPTLVVKGSGLAESYRKKEYHPLSMNRAVALCCMAKEHLDRVGVTIIRMGLQASESLESELLAGPYHPAFGEMVSGRIWFRKVRRLLAACPADKKVRLRISSRDMSTFVGQKRVNMKRLDTLNLLARLELTTDKNMDRGTMEYAVN